jgi:hypothetical protein
MNTITWTVIILVPVGLIISIAILREMKTWLSKLSHILNGDATHFL